MTQKPKYIKIADLIEQDILTHKYQKSYPKLVDYLVCIRQAK